MPHGPILVRAARVRPMKVFAWLLAVVGLIGTAAAGALLVKNMWDLRILYEVAMANKSQASVVNPATMVLIGASWGSGSPLAAEVGTCSRRTV